MVLTLVLSGASASAKVSLPTIFGDRMVLQQQKPIKVWGWADKGQKITVTFAGQEVGAVAGEDGRWLVTLKPVKGTATPQDLIVKGRSRNTIKISDVLVGEVWLMGRQTSIDVSLAATQPDEATDEPQVRYFHIERCSRAKPQADLPVGGDLSGGRILYSPFDVTIPMRKTNAHGPWQVCTKANSRAMTGAAFLFARDLSKKLSVPVGIIDMPMGVSVLESWMSPEAISQSGTATFRSAREDLTTTTKDVKEWDAEEAHRQYIESHSRYIKGDIRRHNFVGEIGRSAFTPEPVFPGHLLLYMSGCYNACLTPIKDLTLRGVLLYQGACYPSFVFKDIKEKGRDLDYREMRNDTWTAYTYNKFLRYKHEMKSFPYFIADWRKTFGDEKLSFGVIEACGSGNEAHGRDTFTSYLTGYREVVARVCSETNNAALIPAHDLRQQDSRQPRDEKILAARCLDWALDSVYQKHKAKPKLLHKSVKPVGDKLVVTFADGGAEGLKTSDGEAVRGFWVGGPTKEGQADAYEYLPAAATITGNSIAVSRAAMPEATTVRYAWTTLADGNVVNGENMPLMPFRTDTWDKGGKDFEPPIELNKPMHEWESPSRVLVGNTSGSPLGPTGLTGYYLGPNIMVSAVAPGSPADGVIKLGDALIGANGRRFETETVRRILGEEIDKSQLPRNKGKLSLTLVSDRELKDVALRLETLPAYSDSSPYDCPRAAKLLADARAFIYDEIKGKEASGGRLSAYTGLNLLASQDPRYLNMVRRLAISVIQSALYDNPPKRPGYKSSMRNHQKIHVWGPAYRALFLAEYYLATGDPQAVEALKVYRDVLLYTQDPYYGAWTHNGIYNPSQASVRTGYDRLNQLGLVCFLSWTLMKEAGIDVDQDGYAKAREYFRVRGACGHLGYGRTIKRGDYAADTDAAAKGLLPNGNGKDALSAIVWNLIEPGGEISRKCAVVTAGSYQSREHGHGGSFHGYMWGPIGASLAGKEALARFMRGQRWYYALLRGHDHSINPGPDNHRYYSGGRVMHPAAAAYTLGYAIPGKGLRVLGGDRSPFGRKYTGAMAGAVEAFQRRQYAKARQLLAKEQSEPAAKLRSIIERTVKSIETTCSAIENDIAIGDLYLAQKRLKGLTPVIAADDPRPDRYRAAITARDKKNVLQIGRTFYGARGKKIGPNGEVVESADSEGYRKFMENLAADNKAGVYQEWATAYLQKHPIPQDEVERKETEDKKKVEWVDLTKDHTWHIAFAERKDDLPRDWRSDKFDKAGWCRTTLPCTWPNEHWAVLRTTFEVPNDTRKLYRTLRFGAQGRYCTNTKVYLNGAEIVRNQKLPRDFSDTVTLNSRPGKLLKPGGNELVILSLAGVRWTALGVHHFDVKLEGAF